LCYDGKYEDPVSYECKDCDEKCSTCTKSDSCIACKDSEHRLLPDCSCKEGFFDDNGLCLPYNVCSEMLYDDNLLVGDC